LFRFAEPINACGYRILTQGFNQLCSLASGTVSFLQSTEQWCPAGRACRVDTGTMPGMSMRDRSIRLGRNDLCSCGSGRKVKNCCGVDEARRAREEAERRAAEEAERRMYDEMRKIVEAEQERQRQYGKVRPIITAKFQNHRFVAVGSRLYFHENWRNFNDFLIFYAQDVIGKLWWQAELARPRNERHPLVKWHGHFGELQRSRQADPETGLVSAVRDGILSAFLALSYDLYVLRNYSKLQDEVVARLRHRDQFQGARYELFVAATFIRAGCDIAYEDESDGSKKHAEFVAKHLESGLEMSVEAKARQRQMRGGFDMATIRPSVRDLLLNAADKRAVHPLVVFLELNLPPEDPLKPPSWVPHVNQVVQEITAAKNKVLFDLIIFTNRPHLYGEVGEPDPSRHGYEKLPSTSAIPEATAHAIGDAAAQYGNIPTDFPEGFEANS
jgi:hypothetical protein